MLNDSKMSKSSGVCDVEEFMQQPLVTWFRSCLKFVNKENCTYEELVDGSLINQVFLQMGLEPVDAEVSLSPSAEEPGQRARNLRAVLANLRHFYEERGDVMLRAPRIARLAREPRLHVLDAELLLCLLLGCAVQCPHKQDFIEHIQSLDVPTQEAIVNCIKQVVHMPNIVLSSDTLSESAEELELGEVVPVLIGHLRRAYRERSRYLEQLRVLAREEPSARSRHVLEEEEEELPELVERLASQLVSRHRDTELADCRAQLRRQRDDLKKAHEELHESREELTQCKELLAKVHKDNEVLGLQAQSAELYRDELDAATERAEKADQLEQEIARYKEKLAAADYLKTQLNEYQDMNQLLLDNNQLLIEKNNDHQEKLTSLKKLKKQLAELQLRKDELQLENEKARKRQQELLEENAELKSLLKMSSKEALESDSAIDPDEPAALMNNSLSEQLSMSAQSRALRLELENRQLSSLVDSLRGCAGEDEGSPSESKRRCAELARDKHNLRRLNGELKARVEELEAQRRATAARARDLEGRLRELQQLEEARREQTVVRRPSAPDQGHGQEHAQLRQDFGLLFREHKRLLKRLDELAQELEAKRSRVGECDRLIEQLRLYCAELASDKRYLLAHSNQLVQQNSELVEQMREAIERHCTEDRKIRDEMNHLSRHKEKLEEKIMEQYRRMPSSAGKKRSIGTNLVKNTLSKMRRASTGFFSRSRRSWAEESSERSHDFDFVRGHESDGASESRNRKSLDFLENFRPTDFSFELALEEPASRKSIDSMELPCSEEPDDAELDRTLHAESKTEEDRSTFAKNKSVDLSLEDLLEEPEHELPNKDSALLDKLFASKNLRKSRSRKPLWLEQPSL